MTVTTDAPIRNGHPVAPPAAQPPARPPAASHQSPANAPTKEHLHWFVRLLIGEKNRPALTQEEASRASARRFCWGWLLFAMAASVGGNFLHSWMTAPADVRVGAAIAAIVPPAVLLGATHLTTLLISTRRRNYRLIDLFVLVLVILGSIAVAYFAFTISFYSLRDLMILFGQRPDVAWRWPIAVDASLVVSSTALMSFAESRRDSADHKRSAGGMTAAAVAAVDNGPRTPAERRLWWVSIATVVREELINTRKIAALNPEQLGGILARLYDDGESARSVGDSIGLHNRETKAIRESANGVLARTAVIPAPAEAEPSEAA
ncbi:hypothetical protein EB73_29380 [Mycobacterium sp. SWH-M3]|nr:hypothetical protein EB73_29380 [Mycobacterium sp. SWH-M3]